MWNLTDINTLSKEHQMLEQYNKHQTLMKNIRSKKGCVYSDDSEPIRPAFLQGDAKNRKKRMCREMEIEIENRNLFNKMQNITTRPGSLNPILLKKQLHQKGSLNLDSRVQTMKNIISQNTFMDGRLQNMKASISNVQLNKEFKINDHYLKSISKHSRRIVNCFLSVEKKKKYMSEKQLTRTVQKDPKELQEQSLDQQQFLDQQIENEKEKEQAKEQEESKEGFFLTGAQQS